MQTLAQKTEIADLTAIIELRRLLHQHPELSGQEVESAKRIVQFIERYHPDEVLTGLGGTGIAIIFEGTEKGPTLLFRAELDALPIRETNSFSYASIVDGVSHKCGHEGHMAILTGLASLLHRKKPTKSKVVLLFQPAEETGAGAWAVLQDPRFQAIQPDYVFALHNMPGLPLHQVLVRKDIFSPASSGMIVELFGKSSHAGEPENGLNPGLAMSELIIALNALFQDRNKFKNLTLITIIHARLGDVAFGTNPGYGTVMATLRAYEQEDFMLLKNLASQLAEQIAAKWGLKCSIKFVEEFPATVNNEKAVEAVKAAAKSLGLHLVTAELPVKWSEDFGHFTKAFPGALFGLGAGLDQPQLHHADYDFPDVLIFSGAMIFYQLIEELTR